MKVVTSLVRVDKKEKKKASNEGAGAITHANEILDCSQGINFELQISLQDNLYS